LLILRQTISLYHTMKKILLPVLGMACLLTTSCSSDCDEADTSVSASVARRVMPAVTDNAIQTYADKPHMAFFDITATRQNKLVVYLPDFGRLPLETADFGTYAASQGYHVVSLRYANDISFVQAASGSADTDAFEKARIEMLTGENVSPLLSVTITESIDNRLVKLIRYLEGKYPGEGWGQYLNGNAPDFSKLILCGSGQGATNAAMFAKQHRVDKVVFFSITEDKMQDNSIAPWMRTTAWATISTDVIGVALPENGTTQQYLWDFMQLHGEVAHIDEDAGVVRANKYVFNEPVPVLVYDHNHDVSVERDVLWQNVLQE